MRHSLDVMSWQCSNLNFQPSEPTKSRELRDRPDLLHSPCSTSRQQTAGQCASAQVVLLDSLRKRCSFVEGAAVAVGAANAQTLWARAEAAGQDPCQRVCLPHVLAVRSSLAAMRMPW